METREEDRDRYEDGSTSSDLDSIQREPSASPRPPILQPEVLESRSDVENPLGALTRGLPDVIQRAKGFYARHPTLVKAVGTVFVAAIARRLFRGRPGLL
jgi:hypothetical protein